MSWTLAVSWVLLIGNAALLAFNLWLLRRLRELRLLYVELIKHREKTNEP